MIVDYEIVWVENGKMNFQQFSYEMDDTAIPLNSYLPEDLYRFYAELQDKKFPIIVFAGEKSRGNGLLRYSNANPVYELPQR